jgi:hypothetical protein
MDTANPPRSEQLYAVLDETLPIVHRALVGYYGFSESEADAFADTLCVWFHRVSRRSANQSLSTQDLREQLLFVACKYARAFQLARLSGERVDEGLSIALGRPAEEVAIALLSSVQRHGAFS